MNTKLGVGMYMKVYDSVVLCRAMRNADIPLQDCIIGFCDTLPMLKNHASCNTTNSTPRARNSRLYVRGT